MESAAHYLSIYDRTIKCFALFYNPDKQQKKAAACSNRFIVQEHWFRILTFYFLLFPNEDINTFGNPAAATSARAIPTSV